MSRADGIPFVTTWERTFTSDKTFGAYNDAESFLRGLGYSVGSMQAHAPTGVMRGNEWDIQKWRNLRPGERMRLDGAIVGDFRSGPVTVKMCSDPTGGAT